MKKTIEPQAESISHELRTEVTEVTPAYWTGLIHRGDGSVVSVEVSNLENLLEKYKSQNQY